MRFVLFVALLAGSAASAQPLGGWAVYFGQVRFAGSPFSVHAEAQLRGHEAASDLDQALLRTGAQVVSPVRA